MKLSALWDVAKLNDQRLGLLAQLTHLDAARLMVEVQPPPEYNRSAGGPWCGTYADPQMAAALRPTVELELRRRLEAVEASLSTLGVEVDDSPAPRTIG